MVAPEPSFRRPILNGREGSLRVSQYEPYSLTSCIRESDEAVGVEDHRNWVSDVRNNYLRYVQKMGVCRK
jgi:hypothetical protein